MSSSYAIIFCEMTIKKIEDQEIIRNYLTDESNIFHGHASALFLPENVAELASVLQWSDKNDVLVSISGGGTSITGSRVPLNGGVVISLEKMMVVALTPKLKDSGFCALSEQGYQILVNKESQLAILPPAIPLSVLDLLLERVGLVYPPDPTELSAVIGGTVATNASGARSYFYGSTRAWVHGLQVVLMDGSIININANELLKDSKIKNANKIQELATEFEMNQKMPNTKNAAGLFLKKDMRLIDIFIGSEGVLGAFSEIEVGLIKRINNSSTIVAFFDAVINALDFVDHIKTNPQKEPVLSLEFFDEHSLKFMKKTHQRIPTNAMAAILFEIAGPTEETILNIAETLDSYKAIDIWDIPPEKREEIRLFRHSLPESINEYVKTRAGKIGTDMAVPRKNFRIMYNAYLEEAKNTGLNYVLFGHIGDSHLHLNFLPENNTQKQKAMQSYLNLAKLAVKLKGTISAEHGVGKKTIKLKTGETVPYLQIMYNQKNLKIIKKIKQLIYLINPY
jgi:D-lactate dehydrogenase (cytochrome)